MNIFDLSVVALLTLLVVAVIGLFAMMGELSSKVADAASSDSTLIPIGSARLGVLPESWPTDLSDVKQAPHALIVVLSTACSACARVASGATGPLPVSEGCPLALVISSKDNVSGGRFVADHPVLDGRPTLIDVEGTWITAAYQINTSPSVLVLENGVLTHAFTFTSVRSIETLVPSSQMETQ